MVITGELSRLAQYIKVKTRRGERVTVKRIQGWWVLTRLP